MFRTKKVLMVAVSGALFSLAAFAQSGVAGSALEPDVPIQLVPPAGNVMFLKAHAVGTQNYVCKAVVGGPSWTMLGPQATLFFIPKGKTADLGQQVATHFLSENPEANNDQQPTWQSSVDSSAAWAVRVAISADPAYVAPNTIQWLLLQVNGTRTGPNGGDYLAQTTYIQRINTSGGLYPTEGCNSVTLGIVKMVPYTADYIFFRAAH